MRVRDEYEAIGVDMLLPDWADELAAILAVRIGHTIPRQKLAGIAQEIQSAASHAGAPCEEYLKELRAMPITAPALQALLSRVTNKESYFFRDAPTVESLRSDVLPRLIRLKRQHRTLRVWSAGCSTGEELYTLAIMLDEQIPKSEVWSIALVGTDIDGRALAHARLAEYGEWSLRATSLEARGRYFEACGERRYRVRAKYRRNVMFSVHNLIDDAAALPWPAKFDLVLCRNVSIYFTSDACDALTRKIRRALDDEGAWISAPSDACPRGLQTRVLPGLVEHTHTPPESPRDSSELPTWRPPPSHRATRFVGEARPPHVCAEAEETVGREARAVGIESRAAGIEEKPIPIEPPQPPAAKEAARPTGPEVEPPSCDGREIARAMRVADLGDTQEALRILDGLLAESPPNAAAFLLRAILRELSGDDAGAMEDLRRTTYVDPRDAEAHLRMGLLHARSGDQRQANRSFRNALRNLAPAAGADVDRFERARALAGAALARALEKGGADEG